MITASSWWRALARPCARGCPSSRLYDSPAHVQYQHRGLCTSTALRRPDEGPSTPSAADAARAHYIDYYQSVIREPKDGRARMQTYLFPRHAYGVSFVRSSGPGGQNVNKTSTKARVELRLDGIVDDAYDADKVDASRSSQETNASIHLMPRTCVHKLRTDSNYYIKAKNVLAVGEDRHRGQTQNLAAAFTKLHENIEAVLSDGLRAETSPEKQQRVQKLRNAETSRRRKTKTHRAQKKAGRAKPSLD